MTDRHLFALCNAVVKILAELDRLGDEVPVDQNNIRNIRADLLSEIEKADIVEWQKYMGTSPK